MIEVIIKNIRQNLPDNEQVARGLEPFLVYGSVYEYENPGNLFISATLEYCVKAIHARGWILKGIEGMIKV